MPYNRLKALPVSIQRALPRHAQQIFRAVFNHVMALARTAGPAGERRAFRIAWAIVKMRYRRTSAGRWVKRA